MIVLPLSESPRRGLSPSWGGGGSCDAGGVSRGAGPRALGRKFVSALRISQNFFRESLPPFGLFGKRPLVFSRRRFLFRPPFRFQSTSQRMKKYASTAIDIAASVIIPGFGLFLQKRWGEAAAFFFSSALAFLIMPPAAYFIWICGIYYTAHGIPENPHAR